MGTSNHYHHQDTLTINLVMLSIRFALGSQRHAQVMQKRPRRFGRAPILDLFDTTNDGKGKRFERQRRVIDAHCRDCVRCRRMIASLRQTISLYRTRPRSPETRDQRPADLRGIR